MQNPSEFPDDFEDDSDETSQPHTHEVHQNHLSAIVPDHVKVGVFSTGVVVMQGAHEFVIDFLLRMPRPHQVVARVVLSPQVTGKMISALNENMENYCSRYGDIYLPQERTISEGMPEHIAEAPVAPVEQELQITGEVYRDSADDLYQELKIAEGIMSGCYANAVMIGHSASEFSFDFITTFFPRSAVACRVFMSAPNVPSLHDSLSHAFQQYARGRQKPPPETENDPPPPENN